MAYQPSASRILPAPLFGQAEKVRLGGRTGSSGRPIRANQPMSSKREKKEALPLCNRAGTQTARQILGIRLAV